jgi:predicted amidophosphoribosyltransferase
MFVLSTEIFVVEWQVVCTKVREGDKRIVRLKEGNPAGCHVVIVDDLVQSGGTLIECQVYLRKPCLNRLYIYIFDKFFFLLL